MRANGEASCLECAEQDRLRVAVIKERQELERKRSQSSGKGRRRRRRRLRLRHEVWEDDLQTGSISLCSFSADPGKAWHSAL